MRFLQRVLKFQAALWALSGLVLVANPGAVVEAFLRLQPAAETALLRILGVAALVLAMLMVMVSQHALETWWWAWAFALLEAGVATICVLHAVSAGGEAAPTLPWWTLGALAAVFAALDMLGLGWASQEKPQV